MKVFVYYLLSRKNHRRKKIRSTTWPLRDSSKDMQPWLTYATYNEICSHQARCVVATDARYFRYWNESTHYRLSCTLPRSFCDVIHGHVMVPLEKSLGDRCACADDAIITPVQAIIHRYRFFARHFTRPKANVYIWLKLEREKTIWPTYTESTDHQRYYIVQFNDIMVNGIENRYSFFCYVWLMCDYLVYILPKQVWDSYSVTKRP